jgi:anti-sigma B factor antagonist
MADETTGESDDLESDEAAAAEDVAPQFALTEDGFLKIYSVGETTVLGFAGQDVPSEFNAAHYRAAITDLVKANQSTKIAFDLTGVRLVPSGMLGLWVSLSRIPDHPLKVQIFNPSDDVREVLAITKLHSIFDIMEVDVSS